VTSSNDHLPKPPNQQPMTTQVGYSNGNGHHNGNGNGHHNGNGNGHHNGNGNGHRNGKSPTTPTYVPIMSPAPVVVDHGEDFDLGHVLTLLKRRALTFVGVTSVAALGLGFWHLTRPVQYRGGFELLVEPVTVVNNLDLGMASALGDGQSSGLDYNSQIQVLRSPAVLEPIVDTIQARYPQVSYQSLSSKLAINRKGDSKVLTIDYKDATPRVTEFVLEQLAEGFIQYSVNDRQADLRRGLEFLDQQLKEKWEEVNSLQSDLSNLQKQHDLVNIETVSASVTERMNAMLAEQEALQVEMSSLQALHEKLQQQVGLPLPQAVQNTNLSESPRYQALLDDYRQLEQAIALESARFQSDTPMIQALEDERQQLLPLLEAEAERIVGADTIEIDNIGFQGQLTQGLVQQMVNTVNQMHVVRAKNEAINRVVTHLQNEMQHLADLGRNFQQIQRELKVAEGSFNQLLATRQELRFQMASQNSPWELMTSVDSWNIAAVDNVHRKLVLSGVVAVLLGAAVALLQDKLDRGFHSTEEIMEATKLPILATVPHTKTLKHRALMMNTALVTSIQDLMSQKPVSMDTEDPSAMAFAEAFYSLRTNLKLLGGDSPIQAVTITSTRPGEGKSTLCAHLAIAATNMGQRVVVIDADMRRPSQHILFSLPNRSGLSHYLSEQSADIGDVLQTVSGNPRLQVLTAGQKVPAPGGLLSSNRMKQLIEQCRQQYDLVIIDTPPLMNIMDAKIASTSADGMLLVAGMGSTPREDITSTLSDLNTTVQAPLLGLIVNNATSKRGGYYEDYYNSAVHSPAG
jgi:succinoglycan biosynthesis transport protein ExoP